MKENEYGSDAAPSPLLLEQRERMEGCPDERQRCLDGVVIKYKKKRKPDIKYIEHIFHFTRIYEPYMFLAQILH